MKTIKTTKRTALIVVALVLFASLLTVFCACDNGGNKNTEGSARIIVDGENVIDLTVNLDKIDGSAKLLPVLKSLKEQGKLALEYEESVTGAYLTKIGTLQNSGNKYIYVFTSLESDKDVSEWATSVEYDGIMLYSSGLGVSEMSLKDGTVIYFNTITI